MGEKAIRTCGVRFGKRDRELRGLVNLIKEEGAVLSEYCSLAVQYFLKFNRFIQIASVVPDTTDEFYNVSLYIEPSLMKQLISYMQAHQIKSRSNLIRLILMKSIEVSKNGEPELTSEFDLMRSMADELPQVIVQDKIVKAEIKKSEEEKETAKEAASKRETAYDDINGDDAEDNTLLGDLFPNLKSQMERW